MRWRRSLEKNKLYEPAEAIALLKEHSKANFDQTVEVAVRLSVDPRHADQQVRRTVVLPARYQESPPIPGLSQR